MASWSNEKWHFEYDLWCWNDIWGMNFSKRVIISCYSQERKEICLWLKKIIASWKIFKRLQKYNWQSH